MSNVNVAMGNGGGVSPARRRGHRRGSRNRPNRGQSVTTVVSLNVPPGVELINWIIWFSVLNRVCVNVLRGFGRVALVDLINLYSEVPNRLLRSEEFLDLIFISGACFSPISLPTLFNAMVRRWNGDINYGTVRTMTTSFSYFVVFGERSISLQSLD
ncbi:hypothetical protein ACET3Z_031943 [Daucus carota]